MRSTPASATQRPELSALGPDPPGALSALSDSADVTILGASGGGVVAGDRFSRELRLGSPLCPCWVRPRVGTSIRLLVLRTVPLSLAFLPQARFCITVGGGRHI